jgi:hypothetical protein
VSITQQVADLRRAARQEADRRLASRLGGTWFQLAQPDAALTPCKPAPAVDDVGPDDQLDALGRPLPPRDFAAIAS